MYDVKPNLVIGFHGCERAIRDQLLNKPDQIIISKKPYDWLGHGMYSDELMTAVYKAAGKQLPQNKDPPHDRHQDRILRELDCAVIEFMHNKFSMQKQSEMKEK
jgi:hypothetical protein